MKRKYNYFYRTENLSNGKFYYGIHKTDNLEDGYLGSGIRLQQAIKNYGVENFEKIVLKYFDFYKDALEFEGEIVNEILIQDVSCYNISLGGQGNIEGYKYGYGPPLYHKETGEMIKAKNKEEYDTLWGSEEYKGITKGRGIYKDKNGKKYSLCKNDLLIKQLNLVSLFEGRVHCRDKNNNFYMVEPDNLKLLNKELRRSGSYENRNHSSETREKMRKTHHQNNHQKGGKNSQFGTCWITNGEENKKIKKEDKIPDGWRLGRVQKNANIV